MTEQEYINVEDLTLLKEALSILVSVNQRDYAREATIFVDEAIERLSKKRGDLT